jgi:hypothetical protein
MIDDIQEFVSSLTFGVSSNCPLNAAEIPIGYCEDEDYQKRW